MILISLMTVMLRPVPFSYTKETPYPSGFDIQQEHLVSNIDDCGISKPEEQESNLCKIWKDSVERDLDPKLPFSTLSSKLNVVKI